MKSLLLYISLFTVGHTLCVSLAAQDFSNSGKEFWLGYGYHVRMRAANNQNMILYFTSTTNATVKVEIPGLNYMATYSVQKDQVTVTAPIPKLSPSDARIIDTGILKKAIHITSDENIVAYAHIYDQNVSGATLLFPVTTLGYEYYSVNFTQRSNEPLSSSFFFVVATEDNTIVEIIPSAANLNNYAAGIPFTVKLNKGEIYSVLGTTTGNTGVDLTGSRVRSINGNSDGSCKKIAVFSGAGKIGIGGTGAGSSDNLIAQALPAQAWGKKYLTVPTFNQPNNFYRICVLDSTTNVKLNGTLLLKTNLINGFYYQFKNGSNSSSPTPNLIEADKPIMVAQYCTTQGQEGNANNNLIGGDPEMIYLSPIEQSINNITVYSANEFAILNSYINVIIPKKGASSFQLDGTNYAASFNPHPADTTYAYATFPVSSGASHRLVANIGFNAIAYGFGQAESYGYNAGTNLRDINKKAAFNNPYSNIDSSVTCINSPLQFSVPLGYKPLTILWDFSAAPNISPRDTSTVLILDSTDAQKELYYYSTGKTYVFNNTNTSANRDTIRIYTTSSAPDGCGNTNQIINVPVKVNAQPTAKFNISTTGCGSDSIVLIDQSSAVDDGIKRWLWSYSDETSLDTDQSRTAKKFTQPGNYTLKLRAITDVGCISPEVSQTVRLSIKPIANFTVTSIRCQNEDITLKDASTSQTDPITQWYWNFNNGTGTITSTTNANQIGRYTSYGTQVPYLVVENATGCKGDTFRLNTLIHPQPEAGFISPEVCLDDAKAFFKDTSKVADGSVPVSYAWNFNAGSVPVTPNPDILTSPLPNPSVKYNNFGYYAAFLRVVSKDGCTDTVTNFFTVNGSTPKAAFEVSQLAPFCSKVPFSIKNKSSVDFGNVTKMEIFWDLINQPAVFETDENPVPDKEYTHMYTVTNPRMEWRYGLKYGLIQGEPVLTLLNYRIRFIRVQ